ncbi:thiamine-phosphate kinase [Parerythrobacter lacustris]|uniref:Thiamine-monophosphate kinase n=1 Tax=Parerythrobacter lacustris TaxID=2969984 RepID=A0ABT1XX86_9SPHN|nr:thiamine-phosphate kinase [Parerythrobacter lacustris]MCR2835067.1 thiamine-phosphate kinase [Parerythrobacter lacustris]
MTTEFDLIARLRSLATHPAARGLNDDAAVLSIGGQELVVTHDMMVEGMHWLTGQDMADVAWKLVAVNLSDLAAKGAQPIGLVLGQMMGADDDRFLEGLAEALTAFEVPLLGGDTVGATTGPRALGLTALGKATHSPVPSRSGAQPGDGVFLVGTVGGAMMGYEALRDGTGGETAAYLRPQPLLAEGQALAPFVSAMMDVSDGLLLDASRIAYASTVTIDLDPSAVPLGAPESRRDDALRWGDDYALLLTARPGAKLPDFAWPIGKVLPRGKHALLLDGNPPADGKPLGYQH